MTARLYTLSDAIAERARDVRCLALAANRVGDMDAYHALAQRARDLENRAGYARPEVVAVRSCTSFAHDPVSA